MHADCVNKKDHKSYTQSRCNLTVHHLYVLQARNKRRKGADKNGTRFELKFPPKYRSHIDISIDILMLPAVSVRNPTSVCSRFHSNVQSSAMIIDLIKLINTYIVRFTAHTTGIGNQQKVNHGIRL